LKNPSISGEPRLPGGFRQQRRLLGGGLAALCGAAAQDGFFLGGGVWLLIDGYMEYIY